MTKPNEPVNEQLIETKQINVTVSQLPGSVIQELEDYIGEAFAENDLIYSHLQTFYALVVGYHAAWEAIENLLEENKRMKSENGVYWRASKGSELELQQTREELGLS